MASKDALEAKGELLKGKWVFIAVKFAQQGAKIALVARSQDKLEDVSVHCICIMLAAAVALAPRMPKSLCQVCYNSAKPEVTVGQMQLRIVKWIWQRQEHFVCLLQTAEACKKAGAPEVDVVPCDMKSSKSIDEMAKTLLDRHKCMDVLVNSAGIFPMEGQTPLEGIYISVHVCVLIHFIPV